MTNKERIVKFCKLKAYIIKHAGVDEDYVYEEDLEEIREWPDEYADFVVGKLKEALAEPLPSFQSDYMTCPWCLLYDCNYCTYVDRHGTCDDQSSTYGRIIANGRSVNELIEKYRGKLAKCFE